MDSIIWFMLALGFGFLAYLLYTRQFRWVLGVVRNIVIGIIAMLGLNFVLYERGLAVGVNAITALIVGLLGIPGLLLLYVTRFLV